MRGFSGHLAQSARVLVRSGGGKAEAEPGASMREFRDSIFACRCEQQLFSTEPIYEELLELVQLDGFTQRNSGMLAA